MENLNVLIFLPIKYVIVAHVPLKQLQTLVIIVYQRGIYVKYKQNVTSVKMVHLPMIMVLFIREIIHSNHHVYHVLQRYMHDLIIKQYYI